MIALDTNLLVYAHRSGVAEHLPAQRAIERAANSERGWGISLPVLTEFWAVVTHPLATARPSSADEAARFVEALTDSGCRVWSPGEGFWLRLARLAVELGISGPRIFDLQIGLIASDQGASEIWTHDRGFAVPPGLRRFDPLEKSSTA